MQQCSSKIGNSRKSTMIIGEHCQEVPALGCQSLNILIVDDQPGVRYLLDAVVKEDGHNSYLATNGMEAVEMVRKIEPNLVFMDIRMPVMDGTKALEKINELGCNTDVVIMTAFTEKDVIDKAYKNGAVRCIIKPFDVDDIRKIIKEAAIKKLPEVEELPKVKVL